MFNFFGLSVEIDSERSGNVSYDDYGSEYLVITRTFKTKDKFLKSSESQTKSLISRKISNKIYRLGAIGFEINPLPADELGWYQLKVTMPVG